MRTTSLADLRAHLSEYLDQVAKTHERVTVTRHGTPEAVLVSVDDLAALEETLDILAEPGALAEIEQARAELDEGGGVSLEDAMKDRDRVRAGDEPLLALQPRGNRPVHKAPPSPYRRRSAETGRVVESSESSEDARTS